MVAVADALVKLYPNSILFGDYARALLSDTFKLNDNLILITDNADMLIDACVRLRTRVGIFRSTRDYKADNSIRADIICAAIEEDPEFDELQSEDNLGFLTAEEWKHIKTVPHVKNTIRNIPEPCVPEMAKVVWKVSCVDLNKYEYGLYLHIVRDGVNVEEYALELAKTINRTITANLVYIKNDIAYSACPTGLDDLKNRMAVPVRYPNFSQSATLIYKQLGWQCKLPSSKEKVLSSA